MANYSTGLKKAMLGSIGFKAAMDGSVWDIYSGALPSSADADATGTKLGTISKNGDGTGVTFSAPDASGVLYKPSGDTWSGVAIAAGTMGYARLRQVADAGGVSATACRMDVQIGVSGAELNFPSLSTVISPAATPLTVSEYNIQF